MTEKGSNNGGGRRKKYSQARHTRIVEALRAGNFNETAADKGSIDGSTFYRWIEWGEKGRANKEGLQAPAEPYIQFAKDCREASTEAEMRAVANIEEAATGVEETKVDEEFAYIETKMVLVARKTSKTVKRDWRASAWLLERRNAARFASRQKLSVEHSGEIKQTVVLHDGPAPHAEGEEDE